MPLVYKLRAWTLKWSASDIKQQQDRIESVPFTATKPSKKLKGMILTLWHYHFTTSFFNREREKKSVIYNKCLDGMQNWIYLIPNKYIEKCKLQI